MEELTLNFFGEETKISIPKDLLSLKAKISEKYLLSESDTNEIILYYVNNNQKLYIINGNDFLKFKETKINKLFLDINQNSKLYLDNITEIKNESSGKVQDQQVLNDLLLKYEEFSKEKKEKEIYYYNKTNEIMNEIKKRRAELVKEQHKALSKYYEKDEEYITKIYNLKRKLNLKTTVRIPKAIKKEEEERIKKEELKKLEEIREKNRIKKEENLKKRKEYQEKVQKLIEEDKKKKKIEKFNNMKNTQKNINSRKEFCPHLSLQKMEEEKRKAAYKCKTVAAETARAFISIKKKEKEMLKLSNDILKDKNNENNTVSVFNKVNEILNKTVEDVKIVAKENIINKNDKDNNLKEKENEKKLQIEKIKKITKETVKEINNLTKLIIEQSNNLIENINNPEINDKDRNNIILKSSPFKKENKKPKKEIHFTVTCDGCKIHPIRGNRYKCKVCKDFDFCENCYEKNKESHGHEFKIIEKPKNTQRMGHKKKDYCGRGIVHTGIRCDECGLYPIVGWRFKCSICDDYNLCENCEENFGSKHNHPLLKIFYSLMLKKFDDYYLKFNNYENNKTE